MRNYKNLSKMTIWDLCAYNAIKNCPNTKKTSNRALLNTKKTSNRAIQTSVQLFIIAELIADKNKNRRKNNGK